MVEQSAPTIMEETRSEEDSEIDLDFEIDDEIKESLDILLSVPLEFVDNTSDEEEEEPEETKTSKKTRGDSVERQLAALFVDDKGDPEGDMSKDMGLENISDNEFDGPESGECDTSDGELPDSPSMVVTVANTPPVKDQGIVDVSLDEDSDVELLTEYSDRTREYYGTLSQKPNVLKSDREVFIENRIEQEITKFKEKKERDSSKVKEKIKSKEKKDKSRKKSESATNDEDAKRKLKLKKYLTRLNQYKTKCLEYMSQISKKCEIIKEDEKNKIRLEKNKIKLLKVENSRLKPGLEKLSKDREVSPHSSTSSRLEKASHISAMDDTKKGSSTFSDKERKSKSEKKSSRSKNRELKDHKIKYQKYIQYLQYERVKCFEEKVALDKHKHKSKRKHGKSKSSSPEKIKDKMFEEKRIRPPVLSFAEFCNSRELASPEKELLRKSNSTNFIGVSSQKKERTTSVESLATTSTAPSDNIHHVDDDKELFITYSDLVEQDKIKEIKKLEEDREKIENILEKDPELQSISVFTSVLFKGSKDSEGIPFMEEGRPPSPKTETFKPKPTFTQPTGPDEIYDWNDDLSTISQSSLSPSRSPVPKVHNKSILNYLENQKGGYEKRKTKTTAGKPSKSSRSRSKSPKKDSSRSKKRKRKHHSSISVSPSPPPLKTDSYKKRVSPPDYLKERWKDHPSLHDRKREYYERPSRSRRRSRSRTRSRVGLPTHHRSRSSSEERHYRRHHSRSRSRSRSHSPPAMVQISAAEKRRKLREEHERALASLRVSHPKPMSTTPLSITFSADGDNFEPVRDNYDPVVMNEVHVPSCFKEQVLPINRGYSLYSGCTTQPSLQLLSCCQYTQPMPHYFYYPPYQYY